jgi:hypothetical protein
MGYVAAGYAVTLLTLAGYTAWVLAKARAVTKDRR